MAVDSTKIALGVCDVTWGGTNLGATKGGVECDITTSTYEVKIDQFGETPVKEIITGTACTVKVPMAETDLDRLKSVLLQSTSVAGAAAPTGAWSATGAEIVGAGSFDVTAGAGTPVVGQTFTFAGHTTVYRVTAYAAPLLTFVQHDKGIGGLVAPVAAAEAITFVAKNKGVVVSSGVNTDLLAGAQQLVLHPSNVDVAITDNDFTVFLAAPVPGFKFKYETGSERIYEVTFKGYADTNAGGKLCAFGAPS